jgi:D-sedoheptulose 7-phosphate isomerase
MTKYNININNQEVVRYFTYLFDHLTHAAVTTASGQSLQLADAVKQCVADARGAHAAGNKLIFVGNGGSAAIASHMATDFSKNGNIRSLALNDSAMVTCLSNDLGYDQVFAKQIEMYVGHGDILVAISSSGRSANIINAVHAARAARCGIITFSGFNHDNPLRSLGNINFYVDSNRYGFVEIAHLTLCHAILDFICGLRCDENAYAAATRREKTTTRVNARDAG